MGRRRLVGAALLLMGAPLLCAVVSFASRPPTRSPWLEPAKPGTRCVLPPDVMRQDHMRYLKSLRDEVVRDGRRESTAGVETRGIGSCGACHLHREQFCDRCHERAGVHSECFDCHVY
jgi:hypothetical protein